MYTIGQRICEKYSFPPQLVDSLLEETAKKSNFGLKII